MEGKSFQSQTEISFKDIQIGISEQTQNIKKLNLAAEWQNYQQELLNPKNNSTW